MKVFYAVDGSQEAFAAVRQVSQFLSLKSDSAAFYFAPPEVIVRHVDATTEVEENVLQSIGETVFAEAKQYLPEGLAQGAATIKADHTPSEGIVIEAENWGADLIVVGARGMSGVKRILLGSVSRAVAHRSTLPVLVSRPSLKYSVNQPFQILFAFDGSESCEAALAAASNLSYPADTVVTAVTVTDALPTELPVWITQSRCNAAETKKMIEHWRQRHEQEKRKTRDELIAFLKHQQPLFSRADVVTPEGHAAEHILDLIDARRIDLVVVGSGGKGPLKRLFLGSVSENVLNHSRCSVLLTHSL